MRLPRRGLPLLLAALPRSAPRAADLPEPDIAESDAGHSLLLDFNQPFLGDWPQIRERRLLRVLTTYNRTGFLIEQGQGRGLEFEAMSWLAQHLNRRGAPGGPADLRVVFIPVPFDRLIPELLAGAGDVIAAGLTVTPDRARRVAFAAPYIRDVDSVVVRHKDALPIPDAAALAGRTLTLVRGTSHLAHARALSARLEAEGHAAIAIREAPEALESEDLLEMVNAGILSATVADSHLAEAWARVLPDIVVEDAALARGEDIAWATRPDAPALKAVLDDFVAERWRVDRSTMATIYRRYFENAAPLRHPLALDERDRVTRLTPHFQTHAEAAGFNWLVLLAQGFQESRLDPRARSHVGAVGVMQLMPATAASVGVRDLTDAEQNIRGGIRYMAQLRSRYFSDPDIDEADRVFFALASYNAGPNRINRLRAEAAGRGLDPNRWFGHVERVVQARVGSEPVRYVANIRAYFLTYSGAAGVLADRGAERREAREELGERAATDAAAP